MVQKTSTNCENWGLRRSKSDPNINTYDKAGGIREALRSAASLADAGRVGGAAKLQRQFPPLPLPPPPRMAPTLHYGHIMAPLFSVKFLHAFSVRFWTTLGAHFGPF